MAVILKNVVNLDNLPHVAVCPFHVKLLSLEQFNHIFLFRLDWKRGVDSVTVCVNVFAGEVRVSAGLEHYLPEWFLISHNGIQYIRFF